LKNQHNLDQEDKLKGVKRRHTSIGSQTLNAEQKGQVEEVSSKYMKLMQPNNFDELYLLERRISRINRLPDVLK
jgi:hypothetical protein